MSFQEKQNDRQDELPNGQPTDEVCEPLDARAQYEKMRAESQKMRKKVLITAAVILASLLALLLGASVLVRAFRKAPGIKEGTYKFYSYPPSEKQVEYYQGLDRSVLYCYNPSGDGLRETVTEENRGKFDASVLFLCDYLEAVIAGDFAAYRAFFSDQCWKENKEICKQAFHPQMIYDTLITYRSTSNDGADRLICYQLEYRIHYNDGSFRRDIGSGISRPQYVTIRISPDGMMTIDRMQTVYNIN